MGYKHACETTVPVSKTKDSIEKLLIKYKATALQLGYDDERNVANIDFKMKGYAMRILFPLPLKTTNKAKNEQRLRTRWRDALLSIKAKLVMVDTGFATFEKEFMPYLLMPDGRTVGDVMLDEIKRGAILLLEAPEVADKR